MLEQPHLRLEIVWADEHMVEVEARASNGRFCGTLEIYTTGETLKELADGLVGFPSTPTQTVEYEEGERGSYAFLSLKFYCADNLGHLGLRVRMEEAGRADHPDERTEAQFVLSCEAAAVDRFQQQLARMAASESGSATLEGS
jgi:hypothetical protein